MDYHPEISKYPQLCFSVIVRNEAGEILLLRQSENRDDLSWKLPSGSLLATDNNFESALVRQISEQTGFVVTVRSLVDVFSLSGSTDGKKTAYVLYEADLAGVKSATSEQMVCQWTKDESIVEQPLNILDREIFFTYQKKSRTDFISSERSRFQEYYDRPFSYYDNDRARLACKAVILNEENEVLLAERSQKPFALAWDLPGGHFLSDDSDPRACLVRECREELGVEAEIHELLQVYSDKGCGPRSPSALAVYTATIPVDAIFVKNIEMSNFAFFSLNALPKELAYHNEIVLRDVERLVERRRHP